MTAAAFTKGLLALDCELPPILVSLVRKDGINALLDDHGPAERTLEGAKARLYPLMVADTPVDDEFIQAVCGGITEVTVVEALKKMQPTPYSFLCATLDLVKRMVKQLEAMMGSEEYGPHTVLYHGETLLLMLERWRKLCKDPNPNPDYG